MFEYSNFALIEKMHQYILFFFSIITSIYDKFGFILNDIAIMTGFYFSLFLLEIGEKLPKLFPESFTIFFQFR